MNSRKNNVHRILIEQKREIVLQEMEKLKEEIKMLKEKLYFQPKKTIPKLVLGGIISFISSTKDFFKILILTKNCKKEIEESLYPLCSNLNFKLDIQMFKKMTQLDANQWKSKNKSLFFKYVHGIIIENKEKCTHHFKRQVLNTMPLNEINRIRGMSNLEEKKDYYICSGCCIDLSMLYNISFPNLKRLEIIEAGKDFARDQDSYELNAHYPNEIMMLTKIVEEAKYTFQNIFQFFFNEFDPETLKKLKVKFAGGYRYNNFVRKNFRNIERYYNLKYFETPFGITFSILKALAEKQRGMKQLKFSLAAIQKNGKSSLLNDFFKDLKDLENLKVYGFEVSKQELKRFGFRYLKNLKKLKLHDVNLPELIDSNNKDSDLFYFLEDNNIHLEKLKIYNLQLCDHLNLHARVKSLKIVNSSVKSLKGYYVSLEELEIFECNEFSFQNLFRKPPMNLKSLGIDHRNGKTLFNRICDIKNLKKLYINSCEDLIDVKRLPKIQEIKLFNGKKTIKFAEINILKSLVLSRTIFFIGETFQVKILDLNCCMMTKNQFVHLYSYFEGLESLRIRQCRDLKTEKIFKIENEFLNFPNLKTLTIIDQPINTSNISFQRTKNLRKIRIEDYSRFIPFFFHANTFLGMLKRNKNKNNIEKRKLRFCNFFVEGNWREMKKLSQNFDVRIVLTPHPRKYHPKSIANCRSNGFSVFYDFSQKIQ